MSIVLTFGGLVTMLLTLTHSILRINVVTNTTTSATSRCMLCMTTQFVNPLIVGTILTVLFVFAQAFVSGYIYHLEKTY